jgi:hypothetical protein
LGLLALHAEDAIPVAPCLAFELTLALAQLDQGGVRGDGRCFRPPLQLAFEAPQALGQLFRTLSRGDWGFCDRLARGGEVEKEFAGQRRMVPGHLPAASARKHVLAHGDHDGGQALLFLPEVAQERLGEGRIAAGSVEGDGPAVSSRR